MIDWIKFSIALSILIFSELGYAQSTLDFSVDQVLPPISVSRAALESAETIMDLNPFYKPSWVREYLSVEVSASNQGTKIKAVGKDDTLQRDQREMLKYVDSGAPVKVIVHYMPENTLSHNDPQVERFSFIVDPDTKATYPGGEEKLYEYLQNTVIDKIPNGTIDTTVLAAIKFTVSETGAIANPHVYESSRNDEVDTILLDAICNMGDWDPAQYRDGKKVSQEFAFTVGNMNSCVINLLNVRRLPPE